MLLWVGLFLLLFTSLTSGQLVDETERADWVDPSDMLNFNSASRTMKREKVVIEVSREKKFGYKGKKLTGVKHDIIITFIDLITIL